MVKSEYRVTKPSENQKVSLTKNGKILNVLSSGTNVNDSIH